MENRLSETGGKGRDRVLQREEEVRKYVWQSAGIRAFETWGGETWEGGEFRGTERIRRKVFVAPIEKVESRGTREQQLNGKLEGPFVRFQADPLASSELFASEYRKSPVNKRRGGKVPSFFTKKTTIFQSWPTRWKLHRQRRNGFEARRLPLFVFSSLARTIRGNKVKEKEGCRRDSQVRIPVSASREVEKGVQTYLRIYLSFQNISGGVETI